jgi:hypothetical protein
VDVRLLTDVDLQIWRAVPAVIGVMLLVFGLVWETGR